MDLRGKCWSGMNWIDLDQNSDLWMTSVNTVMNIPFWQRFGELPSNWATDRPHECLRPL
jgi:hypothetical protein